MKTESFATQSIKLPKSNGKFLSPEEWVVCMQVSMGEPPHNQRARALLAIDAGVTQAEAALQSGLTSEQVRYWVGKFRKDRLNIFPQALLDQPLPETATATADGPAEATDPAVDLEESEHQPKRKGGKKKAGKGKKAKKGKQKKAGKAKKAKKARQGKKSKKKGQKGKKPKKA